MTPEQKEYLRQMVAEGMPYQTPVQFVNQYGSLIVDDTYLDSAASIAAYGRELPPDAKEERMTCVRLVKWLFAVGHLLHSHGRHSEVV